MSKRTPVLPSWFGPAILVVVLAGTVTSAFAVRRWGAAQLDDRMAWIASRNCVELQGMMEAKGDSDFQVEDREQWFLAIEEKMYSLDCFGVQEGVYQPPYSWLQRCDQSCVTLLEREELARIDGYDCEDLARQLPYALNPRQWDDYADWAESYEADAKAVLDKADSMNCP